jgi:hypothetical protein
VSSQDADQVMSMKVEEVSDMQEEDVPVPLSWQAIIAECEVSFMSVYPLLSRFDKYTELPLVFLISLFINRSTWNKSSLVNGF